MWNHTVSDRPVPNDFFAKLWAMNWVEKEHRRKIALRDNAAPAVTRLFIAIKSAIETFNRLYRESPRTKVEFSLLDRHVQMSMALPPAQASEIRVPRQVEGVIEFDPERYTITATFSSGTGPIALQLDADENSKVFVRDQFGTRAVDEDAVSRILLEGFLMPLANL